MGRVTWPATRSSLKAFEERLLSVDDHLFNFLSNFAVFQTYRKVERIMVYTPMYPLPGFSNNEGFVLGSDLLQRTIKREWKPHSCSFHSPSPGFSPALGVLFDCISIYP